MRAAPWEEKKMISSVYSRTFQKAAQLAGGQQKLARHLRVPLAELEKWIAGKAAPPMASFLDAVDLVLEETAGPGAPDPAGAPAPRGCSARDSGSPLG